MSPINNWAIVAIITADVTDISSDKYLQDPMCAIIYIFFINICTNTIEHVLYIQIIAGNFADC